MAQDPTTGQQNQGEQGAGAGPGGPGPGPEAGPPPADAGGSITNDDGSTSTWDGEGGGSHTGADGSVSTYSDDGSGSHTGVDGSPPLGMEMAVEPILMQMAPLVHILPMDLVLTPMLMVIHTAWMPRAIVPLQELMAHPGP